MLPSAYPGFHLRIAGATVEQSSTQPRCKLRWRTNSLTPAPGGYRPRPQRLLRVPAARRICAGMTEPKQLTDRVLNRFSSQLLENGGRRGCAAAPHG